MIGRIDAERILDAFLAPEPDQLPDRVLEAAFTEIARTQQRRALRVPWRSPQMPTFARLAAGVAIVAVLGVGALQLFNRGPDFGGQPTPVPTTSPGTSPAPPLSDGDLAPGRYSYTGDGVRVTVTVPAGWEGGPFHVSEAPSRESPDGANLGFRQPEIVFPDPCLPESGARLIGSTVDDFAIAMAALPNITPATQDPVTISGFEGKHLEFVVDTEGMTCVMGLYGQGSFIRAADNGQRQDLWILDVAGTRLVIDAATYPQTSAEVRAEVQVMVDTLLIEPID